MSIIKEFREFAIKGNVVDMAVGVIVGAAFGKVVSSLVADVIMPPLGMLVGGIDFKGFEIILKEAVAAAPAVSLKYGSFIQTVFDFLIQAVAIFIAIKAINTLKRSNEAKPAPATPPPPTNEERLLAEIRDLLRTNQAR